MAKQKRRLQKNPSDLGRETFLKVAKTGLLTTYAGLGGLPLN